MGMRACLNYVRRMHTAAWPCRPVGRRGLVQVASQSGAGALPPLFLDEDLLRGVRAGRRPEASSTSDLAARASRAREEEKEEEASSRASFSAAAGAIPDLASELASAIGVAERAGEEILRIQREATLDTREKGNDEGPVTAADLAADEMICRELHARFPRDRVVSEEGSSSSSSSSSSAESDFLGRRTWFVDPLDGTANFVKGSPDWCVLIALCDADAVPVLGVVHEPETGATWAGVASGPTKRAWRRRGNKKKRLLLPRSKHNADDGHVKNKTKQQQKHLLRKPDDTWAALPPLSPTVEGPWGCAATGPIYSKFESYCEETLSHPVTTVLKGSAGLKAALVVDGGAHFFASPFCGMHLWDVAAGHALLRAVGGSVTQLDGSPISYKAQSDLVVSRGVFFHAPSVKAHRPQIREVVSTLRPRSEPRNDNSRPPRSLQSTV